MDLFLYLNYFIPFIIVFFTFYALLRRSKVFGEGEIANRIGIILSLSISFLIVFYNPLKIPWAEVFANIYSKSFVVIVFLIFFVFSTMMISSLKTGKPGVGSFFLGFVIALVFASVTNLFLPIINTNAILIENYFGPNYIPYFLLFIFLIILFLIYKSLV